MSLGDCVGKKFEKLFVEEEYRKDNYIYCKCKCDCENTKNVLKANLKSNKIKSCGCLNRELASKRNLTPSLIGKKIGKLLIKEEFLNNKTHNYMCKCECECGNKNYIVPKYKLNNGKTKDCGCVYRKYKDVEIGSRYNRLVVVDFLGKTKSGDKKFLCKCDCGNNFITTADRLKRNSSKSCGCLTSELLRKANRKYNKYNLDGCYGIGYDSKGNEFYFDLEDYDKIKDYYWSVSDTDGYVYSYNNKNPKLLLHKILFPTKNNYFTDHINRKRNDCRKDNLRKATLRENNYNKSMLKTNKSGIIGVSYYRNKWVVRLSKDNKEIIHKSFDKKEDAIVYRLKVEKEHYGEFAPQQHLFKKYNIE